jgi:hypothetical protein
MLLTVSGTVSSLSKAMGKQFWLKSWPLHSVGNTSLILSGQYMTPGFWCVLSWQIFPWILAILLTPWFNFLKSIDHNCGNTSAKSLADMWIMWHIPFMCWRPHFLTSSHHLAWILLGGVGHCFAWHVQVNFGFYFNFKIEEFVHSGLYALWHLGHNSIFTFARIKILLWKINK